MDCKMPSIQLVADLPGHADPAWSVAFNPTRPLLASCSTDKTVRLYSYTSSSEATTVSSFPSADSPKPTFHLVTSIPTSHKRTIRSVAWAPSGKTLATGSFDSTVGVWEEVEPEVDEGYEGVERAESGSAEPAKEWECVTVLEGHDSECKSVGFSADGALLASCSRDKSVWVWEVQPEADFECISVLMEHTQDVKAIAWHPHEEILASASYDAQIHLLFDDPDSDWCPFQKLQPALRASPMPTMLASQDPSEDLLEVPPLREDETVWSLAWSPCGRFLASAGDLGGIRIWTRTGQMPDSTFKETLYTAAHTRTCFSLSWAKGGVATLDGGLGLLASAGADGRVIVWQTATDPSMSGGLPSFHMEPLAFVDGAHGVSDANAVAWCQREDEHGNSSAKVGHGLLATAGDDGTVKVWRVVQ